jgi:transketolase N-terminal domain/subunit
MPNHSNVSSESVSLQNRFDVSTTELKEMAKKLRRHVISMIATAGSGHPGGSLSAADIITALYFKILRYDPENPQWADRDRFILSKGHAAPILYAALAEAGASKDTLIGNSLPAWKCRPVLWVWACPSPWALLWLPG